MDKKQKQTHPEVGEDATQYGEFVSTYFAWIPLPNQKEKAEEMANITKREKRNPVPNYPGKKRPGPNLPEEEK